LFDVVVVVVVVVSISIYKNPNQFFVLENLKNEKMKKCNFYFVLCFMIFILFYLCDF